jgi:hypothetical protein
VKKALCICALAAGVLIGALYWVDLFVWCSPQTGFSEWGPIWVRYALLLVPVALAFATGLTIHRKRFFTGIGRKSSLALLPLAVCSEVYGFLTLFAMIFDRTDLLSGQTISENHADALRALQVTLDVAEGICAMLFVVFGIWCLLLFLEPYTGPLSARGMLYLGVIGSLAFYVHTVVRFIVRPASWYRVQPAVEILAALSALLFVVAFLRANYLPGRLGGTRSVCRNGIIAFFLCTCLAAPQAVWQYTNGVVSVVTLPLAITLGCTGLLGAAAALSVVWND